MGYAYLQYNPNHVDLEINTNKYNKYSWTHSIVNVLRIAASDGHKYIFKLRHGNCLKNGR